MSGNTFGNTFKVTTWGESHGKAFGVVIDGCPANISISEKDIQKEIDRRKPQKNSKISTSRKEKDKVIILSGILNGKTLGTPIALMVENKDIISADYSRIKNLFRPGHADLTYTLKYGIRDYRGGGRASGRETISRVMAGAIAKKILQNKTNTKIFGHTIQVGDIRAHDFNKSYIEKNAIRCADKTAASKMIKYIKKVHTTEKDSVGAIIEIIIQNPPKNLGSPVFDKLDAQLAKAMMSIGAVKGFEIGSGFKVAQLKGSENNDELQIKNGKIKFLSNNSGGILGGISTGEDIVIRLAIKPTPSIEKSQQTITDKLKNTTIKTLGRHDICLAPRIIPVAESMAAITILDFLLQQ
jgi:chorismate synthase